MTSTFTELPIPIGLTDRICTETGLREVHGLMMTLRPSPRLTQLDHDRPILDRYSFLTIGLP